MIHHEDLRRGEVVTLLSPAGRHVPALYVTSDALRVYFHLNPTENTRITIQGAEGFRRLKDGGLAKRGRRWIIQGERARTRAVLAEMPPRAAWDVVK